VTSTIPFLRPDPPLEARLLAGWAETGDAETWAGHRARHGALPLPRGRAGRAALIDTVDRAGLRGRGGGAYPTARKLAAVAAGRGPRIAVGNGCEGDPASGKDRTLLHLAPHLVLDGLVLAAAAVGAAEALLCVSGSAPRQAARLDAAVAERAGGDPVGVQVVRVPDHYVASEESALARFLTDGDPRPTAHPPRPAERGVRGRPTLVDNVETLAHLALIARHGPGWYRGTGTATAPGTTLITLGGAVAQPGVFEIACGTAIDDVLERAGGPTVAAQAVLVGGLGGAWLPLPEVGAVPVAPDELRAAGASGGGVAALHVLPERACGLVETARVVRYLAGESAGQCGPCMFGLPAVADDLEALVAGRHGRRGLIRLRERMGVVRGRGACAHPDGAVALAASALTVFSRDAAAHASGKPCRWTGEQAWLPVPRVRR
jgi:NADH:ubiquinone oxidoreductase subunit F (NADH-binding)